MVIDESARRVMHELDDVLGWEVAATLMAHLPPVGWQDVARRSDIDHLAAATKGDIDHLAAATQRDLAVLGSQLRQEMTELGSQLRQEMTELGSELRQEMAALGEKVAAQGEKIANLRAEFKSDLNWLGLKLLGGVAFMMVAAIVAVAGVVP
jgi:DNA repair exonuclease SbcCD ATPase subunit